MNVEELRKSGYIIFECVSGSHAYGTNIATSDTDIRGIYIMPESEKTLFRDHPQEIADDTQDVKFFELEKFMKLASENNPNVLELLFTPEDCIIYKDARMDILLENRHAFVSQKAFHSFSGYAFAQIQKAKGKNKKVNNPQPVERPVKENYCFIIPDRTHHCYYSWDDDIKISKLPPYRPIPLKELDKSINLSNCHVARLEQTANLYRLYHYGDSAKGVFRGDENLVPESIPLEDEFTKCCGLLIYNEDAYKRDIAEWKSYWDWKNNRNEARWGDQENGLLDYDQKNMSHCYRLILSGMNILNHGEPIVRFTGTQLQYLRDIRSGKFKYEEIMNVVDTGMKELELMKQNTMLKHSVNNSIISSIYKQLIDYGGKII